MKNLDLSAIGVQEMDVAEMQCLNGGFGPTMMVDYWYNYY
jgi:hypothetical protein